MRMFLTAVVVMVALSFGAAAVLSVVQQPVAVAFATKGARVDVGE